MLTLCCGSREESSTLLGQLARQLGLTIPDWLLMGLLPGSTSSGTPTTPAGVQAACCLCQHQSQCGCKSGKESTRVGCTAPSKDGGQKSEILHTK